MNMMNHQQSGPTELSTFFIHLHWMFGLALVLGIFFFAVWVVRNVQGWKLKTLSIVLMAVGLLGSLATTKFATQETMQLMAWYNFTKQPLMEEHADHSDPRVGGMNHSIHTPIEIDADNVPTVEIELLKDPIAGWNLHVITENFTFAPQQAGLEHVPGEGHAHLYVNDEKAARLYEAWMHLPYLLQGTNEVKVTLNANNHSPLTHNGEEISAVVVVEIDGNEDIQM